MGKFILWVSQKHLKCNRCEALSQERRQLEEKLQELENTFESRVDERTTAAKEKAHGEYGEKLEQLTLPLEKLREEIRRKDEIITRGYDILKNIKRENADCGGNQTHETM